MLLQIVLFTMYLTLVVSCWWLARRHRDKPVTQALLMPIASFAIYAMIRRVMLWAGDGAVLLADRFLVVFWVYELSWVLWAVAMTVRGRQGKTFLGPDGQRWQVIRGARPNKLVAVPVQRHEERG
jgi:uncharacterized membrane protein